MPQDLDKLQQLLDYQFSDPSLARLALTHSSAGADNNERLEFLGDSILGYVAAELLFERLPQASEGELSRWRANIVNRSALVDMARQLSLSEHLLLGSGEAKSGGKQRESILSNAVEALIAAIYLDGGLDACKAVVQSWIVSRLAALEDKSHQKDFKTRLQELLQARGLALPIYRVTATEGEPHRQMFTVECEVALLETPQSGAGSSKRMAEQEAARKTIAALAEVI